jgi:uncharacterized protein YdgA (DUF945 family)
MDKITFIDVETLGETQTHAIIEHADGSFTSMLKSTYEAQQAKQSTPSVTNGD